MKKKNKEYIIPKKREFSKSMGWGKVSKIYLLARIRINPMRKGIANKPYWIMCIRID